jgi:hypothetical protein
MTISLRGIRGLKGTQFGAGFLLLAGSFLPIVSGCGPKKTEEFLGPAKVLGLVVGDEVLRLAGAKKKVLIISPDKEWGPPSTTELALKKELEHGGCAVSVRNASLGDPMHSGIIGLKKEEFIDAVASAGDCGAIVSLAGAPLMLPSESLPGGKTHPPVLVVATAMLGVVPGVPGDRMQLAKLLEAQIIQAGVIDSEPQADATPGADKKMKSFNEHYRFLRPAN